MLVLSTNGFLLKKMAKGLKNTGLSRVNVSLDSLKSDRVLKISQKDALKNTLEGIEESLKAGLKLKLNTVVIKSVNDDEILELLEYAKNRHIQIRYIEFMENTHAKSVVKGLKEREILDLIAQKYQIIEAEKPKQGSSKIYTLENGYQFGIIAPHSDDFCQSCNRIRLASDGKICPCLYYQDAIDAKEAIVNKDTKNIKRLLKQSVINKPEKNMWNDKNSETPTRAFYYTGGVGHRRVGKIFIILNLFVKNKAVCLGFLVIVARIKQECLMEKILAFFISSFFIPSVFYP
ncbi:hypothetical protein HpHA54_08870 [Helicobacter pylori]